MNRRADFVAGAMSHIPENRALAAEASEFGVRLDECPVNGSWFSNDEGYRIYLALSPEGAQADEAEWRIIAHRGDCGDEELDGEEVRERLKEVSHFVNTCRKSHYWRDAFQLQKQYTEFPSQ